MALSADPPVPDGRRLRRERNRTAVIDAVFELLVEGHFPPSVEDVADRSGVSVSSVFRYFEGLDDLQQETVERYFERFAPLMAVPCDPDASTEERIASLVTARLDLYEAIAPIARMARHQAPLQPRIAENLHATRVRFGDQIREHFAPELEPLGRAESSDRVALIDALTAFEAWDLLHSVLDRSRRLVERAWRAGIATLLV
jgi:TetR/AcrR family transcriptional regulator of autoinduction and epiphytic fitness